MTRRATFSKAEITRAIRAAEAAQVLRRPVTCAPDLSIEARLMQAGGAP